MSEDNDLDDLPVTKVFTLKTRLIAEFGSIDYHIFGNRLVVHSSAVNHINILLLQFRAGETDLTKAFSSFPKGMRSNGLWKQMNCSTYLIVINLFTV